MGSRNRLEFERPRTHLILQAVVTVIHCDPIKSGPKTNTHNSTKTYQLCLNCRRNNCKSSQEEWRISLETNTRQHRFYYHIKCITENMKFTTQQLRSYAPKLWECQALESDEFFLRVLGHFLDLMPAPQLNQRFEQSASYAFYNCRICNSPYRFDQIFVRNLFTDDGDHAVSGGKIINFLTVVSVTNSLTQEFNGNFGFCGLIIVYTTVTMLR